METIVPETLSSALRVLLIEDSVDDAELLELELRSQGFDPDTVRVETRLELEAALDAHEFDVVLCDHSLPTLDALAALAIVKRSGLDLPFVIVSDVIPEATAIETMRAGAHDYVFKRGLSRLGAVIEREVKEATIRAESRRLQQRLVLADRLSSVGMLAAGVAHEINNPLAYVLGNLEFALDHLPAGDGQGGGAANEVGQALTQAREGAERIRQTTRDLRVFCRTDQDERRAVDVLKVMESSIRMAWNELRHRARLVRRFGSAPSIIGNEARLGQVFLNLLVNAAHSIPEGDTEGNQVVVSIRALGDLVLVEVTDTGSGIAPQHLGRIFEPFFTTKPEGIGSGIGLSICQSIVADLGGEIRVQSKLGAGSSFSVHLPAQVAFITDAPAPKPIASLRRARILAIDDEPSLCAVLKRLLKRDHDVISFTDAREALQAVRADGGFDVVFCDLMMPSMSGIDFHRELLELDPDLASRTVFVTGGAFNGPARKFLETVPNRVLEKPFDGPTLFGIINQVLDSFPRSGTWLTRELERAL